MTDEVRVDWQLPNVPHLRDHAIGDVAVVPAVDLIAWLARATSERRPSCAVRRMGSARFVRALPVEPFGRRELAMVWTDGPVCTASIWSRVQGMSGIVRNYEHASVEFDSPDAPLPPLPPPLPARASCEVPLAPRRVYESLVPLGPWFHNLQGDIELSELGARATARVPAHAEPNDLLGSPFLLDAALHLACVWGQRYAGVVALPTGFQRRTVVRVPRDQAQCLVVPREANPRSLMLDVWLCDREGEVCDVVEGLQMMPWHAAAPPPSYQPKVDRGRRW